MKKSMLFLLAAAMPVFAQGPAPEVAPAPAPAPVAGAPVDANNDGVISTEEAIAARDSYVKGNADKFGKKPGMRRGHRHGKPGMGRAHRHGKPGMKHEGRRPHGPKAGKHEGRKPGMKHEGRRPMGPEAGKFGPQAPKCGKFQGRKPGMHEGFRPQGPQAPQFNGCRCGKKHAPGVQPRGCKKAA